MNNQSRKQFLQHLFKGSVAGALGYYLKSNSLPSFQSNTEESSFVGLDLEKDWLQIRNEFSLAKSPNYFNTAGLGSSPLSVNKIIYNALLESDEKGTENRKLWEPIRTQMGQFLNTSAKNLAFTRNTTEGINIVARELNLEMGDEIIISAHEHIGGASPWYMLAKEKSIKVTQIELNLNGEGNFEKIKNALSPKTKLLCISHITCTNGMVMPVKKIAALCRERNIISCIDGAQAFGMIPINLDEIDADFYASSGHKWMLGPKGTGFLYANPKAFSALNPVFSGAYSDKKFNGKKGVLDFVQNISRIEYGTRNIPLILGLGAAIRFQENLGFKKISERNLNLAQYFASKLSDMKGIDLLSPKNQKYASAIVSFRVVDKNYISVRDLLNSKYAHRTRGIYENDLKAIRVSVSLYNNKEQLDDLLKALQIIVNH